MSDDASLTDFVGGEGGEGDGGDEGGEDESGNSGEHDGGDEGDEAVDDEECVNVEREENDESGPTEPAKKPTYTYTSTPDGAECEACGDVVEKRWHAGEGGTADDPALSADALVCDDCKAW